MGANRRHRPDPRPVVAANRRNPTVAKPLNLTPLQDDPSRSAEKPLGQLAGASRLLEPLHFLAASGAAIITAGLLMGAGAAAVATGCLDPTPFEPLTCGVGLAVGVPVTIAGVGITAAAAYGFFRVTLPAIREDWGLP